MFPKSIPIHLNFVMCVCLVLFSHLSIMCLTFSNVIFDNVCFLCFSLFVCHVSFCLSLSLSLTLFLFIAQKHNLRYIKHIFTRRGIFIRCGEKKNHFLIAILRAWIHSCDFEMLLCHRGMNYNPRYQFG